MAKKLFGNDKVVSLEGSVDNDETQSETLDEIEDLSEDMDVVTEATGMALERLGILQAMQDSMMGKKLCSDAYIAAIENYQPIAAKLGVEHLPSIQDFRNRYAAESAHTYTVEGFKETLKNFWEKIKSFFKKFFKKVTIFFKRLLKANLDLESYEHYCEQLIAKLVTNKATLGNTAAIHSKLPSFVASKGDTKIDSDYLLRAGSLKIDNLVKTINNLKPGSDNSVLSKKALKEFESAFATLVEENKGIIEDPAKLDISIKKVRDTGTNILTNLFKYKVLDPKSLPEEVYTELTERYSHTELSGDDVVIRSIVDIYSNYSELPRGSNLFVASIGDGSKIFARGSMEDRSYVENRLNPISNVENLNTFYKAYKNGIAKVDIKSMVKAADDVGSATETILNSVGKSMPVLLASVARTSSDSLRMGDDLFSYLSTPEGKAKFKLSASVATLCGEMVEDSDSMAKTEATVIMLIYASFEPGTPPETLRGLADQVNKLDPDIQSKLYKGFMELTGTNTGTVIDPATADAIKVKLSDLSTYLNLWITTLQLLYKGIASVYFQQVTEIRYATIKYIYDSARLYNY